MHASALIFSLVIGFTAAFIVPEGVLSRTRVGCFLSAKKNNEVPKRKPRFTQDAHVAAKQQRRSRSDERTTNNKKTPVPSEINDEYMWRTGKSIEELENKMSNRWGKDNKWTADPDEYEFEDIKFTPDKPKQKSRGRQVLDPWQKRELKGKPGVKNEDNNSKGTFGGGDGEGSRALNRARKNQETFQTQKARSKKIAWDFIEDDEEYYDEDDEGFESDSTSSGDDIGRLISPKPVGGRGSKEPANDAPGYFFNPNAARTTKGGDTNKKGPSQEVEPKRKSKAARATPLYDEMGNALYLTVAQAETNFRKFHGVSAQDEDAVETKKSSWQDLGITNKKLLQNLRSMGCEAPLSVQEKSSPCILTGTDVLVGTATGSGKTLSFLVPLAERLLFDPDASSKDIQVMVVAPGRELASQIASVARSLLEGTNYSVMLAIGGTTFSRNLEQIRKKKPTIVIGTPGRIAELVVGQAGERRGRLNVPALQAIVLDEFDALLEYKPHREPTGAIMSALKRRHGDRLQSILCSATASDMIGSASLEGLLRPGYAVAMADKDDKLLTPGNDKKAITRVSRTVIHGVVHVPRKQLSLDTIRRLLHTEPVPQQVLIFADDARRVDLVVDKLASMDIIAAPLHGGFNSDKMDRAEVSKALREGYIGVVVATELAARGLDAPLLTHVINLDLPTDASHYAHRAGRCGRGGRPGVVVSITTSPKERNVPRRFADKLGVDLYAVEPRAGKIQIVDEDSETN